MVNRQKQSLRWRRKQLLRHGPRETHAPLAAALVVIVLAAMVPLAGAGLIARLASSERPACSDGSIPAVLTDCAVTR
ncbi:MULTISPECIES: hypothetical protein [unclassified Bradyrhizobium]|uniref:hypothetical protein n=1 Tax=unclassified Bradyrhizobium TaxID=2631580 RepID=UPI0029161770|nr:MULTISPECIES: hypothetical protein [unclassified Bradyrhizobium]